MNWHTIVAVFRKELRETLRDRRTLAWIILAPAILFPAITIASKHVALFGRRDTTAPYRVIASGDAAAALAALTRTSPGTDIAAISAKNPRVVILPDRANAVGSVVERVRSGDADAAVYIRPSPAHGAPVAQALYDQTRVRSSAAEHVVRDALVMWRDTLVSRRLALAGDVAPLPLDIARDSSVVTSARRQVILVGQFIPFLLILLALLATFSPAIDMTAGERERGTLELLLVAGGDRRDLVVGKFLAISVIGIAAAVLNLVSLLATLATGALGPDFRTVAWQVPVVAVVALIPLVALFSALLVSLGIRSGSFKEGQSSVMPLQFAVMLPAAAPLIPGVVFGYGWALVPIANIALLVRGVLLGDVTPGPAVTAIAITATYAAIALSFAVAKFRSETIVVDAGPGPESTKRHITALGPKEGIVFATAVILAMFYIGGPLQAWSIKPGLLVMEYGLMALPALVVASRTGRGSSVRSDCGCLRREPCLGGSSSGPVRSPSSSYWAGCKARYCQYPVSSRKSFRASSQLTTGSNSLLYSS